VVVVVVVVGGAVVVVVGADVVVVVVVTVVVGAVDVVGDPSPFPPEQADSTSSNPVHKAMTRTRMGPP
jgi:hypothetical protein